EKEKGRDGVEREETFVYAQRTGTDYLFLVPVAVVKELKQLDLRDRSGLARYQARIGATLASLTPTGTPPGIYPVTSPLGTVQVGGVGGGKGEEVKMGGRARVEVGRFGLIRRVGDKKDGKDGDKRWSVDKGSSLEEFSLDSDKVAKFVEELATLKAA